MAFSSRVSRFKFDWHSESMTLMGKEVPAIKHDASQMHPVTAYRCPKCGVLKLFAADGRP